MKNLEKAILKSPLSFLRSTKEEGSRILGVAVFEITRDRSVTRTHHFDSRDGIYLGYSDENAKEGEPRFVIGHLEVSYKRINSEGQRMYRVKKYIGRDKISDEVIPEEELPRIIQNENNELILIGENRLQHIEGPLTNRERLEAQAEAEGRSLAEITSREDNYLNDTPEERLERERRNESSSELPKTPTELKSEPLIGEDCSTEMEEGEGDQDEPGSDEQGEGGQRRMIY